MGTFASSPSRIDRDADSYQGATGTWMVQGIVVGNPWRLPQERRTWDLTHLAFLLLVSFDMVTDSTVG